MGVAVWLWGSMGLTSRGWGLWSRKRHRQEVRAGESSLEMLYHHYQQGTVSYHGHKKLWGLNVCVCESVSLTPCRDRSMWMHTRMTNITLPSRVFHMPADIVWCSPASVKDLRKTLCYCFLPYAPSLQQVQIKPSERNGAKLSAGNTGEELEARWHVGEAGLFYNSEENSRKQGKVDKMHWCAPNNIV